MVPINLSTLDQPSKSSQTTSPVLGQMVIMPSDTSAAGLFFVSSIKHINGGGVYLSRSSTESRSSTYLAHCENNHYHRLGNLRCSGVEMD